MIGSLETPTQTMTETGSASAETWRANVVDSNRIRSRLTQQWLRLKGPRPQRLGSAIGPGRNGADHEPAPGTYARTNTTNLIAVARSAAQAARIDWAISGLQTHYPTRAITIVSDPALDRMSAGPGPVEGALSISTRLVRPDSGSAVVGHFESVTVTGGPRRLGNPFRTAVALCIPDLPIVVWWAGDVQYDLGMVRDLAMASDRVIVDSAVFGDVPRGLTSLAPLVGLIGQSQAVLADMAWLRLRDWRNVIAQFYDAPPDPAVLASLSSVTIEYVADPAPGSVSGLSSALLLAGWLASRLGWRMSDGVARTSSGLRLVFTSPRNHPVIVRLQALPQGDATMGLTSVTLTSTGAARAEYRVEQFDDAELLTTSSLPKHLPLTRHVMVAPQDDAALLECVLQDPARDSVYDDALATVAAAFARR